MVRLKCQENGRSHETCETRVINRWLSNISFLRRESVPAVSESITYLIWIYSKNTYIFKIVYCFNWRVQMEVLFGMTYMFTKLWCLTQSELEKRRRELNARFHPGSWYTLPWVTCQSPLWPRSPSKRFTLHECCLQFKNMTLYFLSCICKWCRVCVPSESQSLFTCVGHRWCPGTWPRWFWEGACSCGVYTEVGGQVGPPRYCF